MNYAEKVRYVREKLMLTQIELSKLTGIPQITISRWENSVQKPSAKQWGKFKSFCECKNIIL